MAGKWQRLILETLEQHEAFYLTDLLAEPYSLSDYNALTRACRNLAKQGAVYCIYDGNRLIVAKHPWLYKYPTHIKPKIRSENINAIESYCWKMGRHPRAVWRSHEYAQALEYISSITGIEPNALAKARTLSCAATLFAAALSFEYREAVAAVICEAYKKKRRFWRQIDLAREIFAYYEVKMSQQNRAVEQLTVSHPHMEIKEVKP